jgi:hypothetical protein
MLDGSNDTVWRKEVPFEGLVSLQKRPGAKFPENTYNRTRKGEIPAKTKQANNF